MLRALRTAPLALAALLAAAAGSAAPRVEAVPKAEIAAIVDLFYGHDFDRAAPAAAALETRHPGHPAGPLFTAVVEYQRWIAEGMKENGSWKAVDRDLSRAVHAANSYAKT